MTITLVRNQKQLWVRDWIDALIEHNFAYILELPQTVEKFRLDSMSLLARNPYPGEVLVWPNE